MPQWREWVSMKQSANEAEADTERAQRSATLIQLFNLTGTDGVSNLVRGAAPTPTDASCGIN
jgi:hypothetical protein